MVKVHIPYNKVSTNFNEKNSLRIDKENIDKMFYMISEAPYRDPLGTVIREYLSNALDEHVILGIEKPIEIYLPTMLQPNLKIKDYGRGMSLDFVENEFCSLGCTTKNDDNLAIGGWGVGGKSFAALTDEVLYSTIQDGYKTVFTMYKDPEMALCYSIISHSKTEEPNGTTVSLHIDNKLLLECEKKVAYWTSYLSVPIKIIPELSEEFFKRPIETLLYSRKDWKLFKSETTNCYREPLLILIGGLPYPIEDPDTSLNAEQGFPSNDNYRTFRDLLKFYYNKYQLVIEFNPGVLELTVGREDLRYSDKTKTSILNKIEEVIEVIRNELSNEVNEYDNIWQASLNSTDLIRTFRVKYKGSNLLSNTPSFTDMYFIDLSSNDRVLKRGISYLGSKSLYNIIYDDLFNKDPSLSLSKYKKLVSSKLRRFFKDQDCKYNICFIENTSNITKEWISYLDPVFLSSLPESESKVIRKIKDKASCNKVIPLQKSSSKNTIVLREWVGQLTEDSTLLWKYCSSVELELSKVKGLYIICNRGEPIIETRRGGLINYIFNSSNPSIFINKIYRFLKEVHGYENLYLIKESDLQRLNKVGVKLDSFNDLISSCYAPLAELRSYSNLSDDILELLISLGNLIDNHIEDNIITPEWLEFYIRISRYLSRIKLNVSDYRIITYPFNGHTRESLSLLKVTFNRITKLCFFKLLLNDNYYYKYSDLCSNISKTLNSPFEVNHFISLINQDYIVVNKSSKLPFDGDAKRFIDLLLNNLNINNINKDFLLKEY